MIKILTELGGKNQKILELWKLSYSMEEIAEKVGLKNAGVARRQRYKSFQKLVQLIEEREVFKQLLEV